MPDRLNGTLSESQSFNLYYRSMTVFSEYHRLVVIQWLDKFIEPDIKCRGCTEVAIFIQF